MRVPGIVSATIGVLVLSSAIGAQARKTIVFAKPTTIVAEGKELGAGRGYPSPILRDMNGDGRLDIVCGSLTGTVTLALRRPGEGIEFGSDRPFRRIDGQQLAFVNW